ncbi:hypothetical protein TUM17383_20320 [Shewanella algae]|nr:hypothetical protein TUM17383_20320 [Shewanella algae]
MATFQFPRDPSGETIGPGRFNKDASGVAIAALSDAATPFPLTTGVFAGCQTDKVHQ